VLVSWYFLLSFIGSILIKTVFEYKILSKGKELLFISLSLKPMLIAEIFQMPYIITAGFIGAFGNFKWKQRKVKR
jgi:hypothetical protein